ncbi:hypothetical protein KPH14_009418 [Odynerus spinipes]|uniref:OCEL domain-containing protein n=1 Tax=Odynerus spinipes TaxID=1348599 RepID=A0AAD9VQY0_9HYME|nr:hypothetical protein KPH14_009418 [Odynerus spinipes]
MAALVAGVQYGLSSHSNFHENKSLIFVKLTDSAQRAIEDFLRNRNKTSQNPTIQFLGNEGQLSFPSTQSSHGSAGFTFSLSGNQDIEGPQGGFECIQQTGPTSLESLGALPCKMRIQANDDVYETTRHRMAVAEENNKNKCTRVIKANGPDIGRKVKVKGRTIPPPLNNNPRHRESSNIPPSSIANHQSRLSSSYKPAPSSNPPPVVRNQPEKKVSDIMRRPLKERLIHLLALRPYKKPELYDRISREGIKERERSSMTTILKQVAFMRDNTYHLHRYVWNDVQEDWPYYSEQEKAMLKRRKPQNLTPPGSSDGGSSGSGQSPNSVHPGSPPAITAPPPNLLNKRPGYYQGNDGLPTKKPRISHYKKPEPGSNVSSTNTTSSSSSSSSKGSENGRTAGSGGVSGGVIGSGSVGSCVGGSAGNGGGGGGGGAGAGAGAGGAGAGAGTGGSASGGGNNGGLFEIWEQRPQQHQPQQQQQQRERRAEYRPERTSNSEVLRGGGSYANGKACLTPSNNADESNHASDQRDGGIASNEGNAASANTAGHNSHSNLTHSNSTCNSSRYHHGAVGGGGGSAGGGGGGGGGGSKSMLGSSENAVGAGVDYLARNAPSSASSAGNAAALGGGSAGAGSTGGGAAGGGSASGGGSNSTSGGYSAIPNGVINERRDRSDRARGDRDRESRKRNSANSGTTGSTTTDHNLRRRYKAEFNADYEEYKRLHAQVAMVSGRFKQLEERLKEEEAIGNIEGCKEVKRQILMEYNETKRDPLQRETKRRFHYLHEKLSHIKRLVLEYDTQNNTGSMMVAASNGNTGDSKETKEMDSLRY